MLRSQALARERELKYRRCRWSAVKEGLCNFGQTWYSLSSRYVHRFVNGHRYSSSHYFLSRFRFVHLFFDWTHYCTSSIWLVKGNRESVSGGNGAGPWECWVISGECILFSFLDLVSVSVATCLPLSWLYPSIFILLLTWTPLCANRVANQLSLDHGPFESPQWIASAWFYPLGHRIKALHYCPCTTGRMKTNAECVNTHQVKGACKFKGTEAMSLQEQLGDRWVIHMHKDRMNERSWELIFCGLVELGYDVRGLQILFK